jgi:hypothetical protein
VKKNERKETERQRRFMLVLPNIFSSRTGFLFMFSVFHISAQQYWQMFQASVQQNYKLLRGLRSTEMNDSFPYQN